MIIEAIEAEIERQDHLIKAAENWAPQYHKKPKVLAKLIKFEARLERVMRSYFRHLANERLDKYINWGLYQNKVQAFRFDVMVDVDEFEDVEYDELLNIMHDPLQLAMALGAETAEEIYNIQLGLNQYHDAIMKASAKYTADLVKGVNKTTKNRISNSINQSIRLGEDITAARTRLQSIIADVRRAELIARTETVNSYSKGISVFGEESGAVGKIWEVSSDPCAICADNDIGEIPFDETFPSGDDEPTAHPNCRCGMSLIHSYA